MATQRSRSVRATGLDVAAGLCWVLAGAGLFQSALTDTVHGVALGLGADIAAPTAVKVVATLSGAALAVVFVLALRAAALRRGRGMRTALLVAAGGLLVWGVMLTAMVAQSFSIGMEIADTTGGSGGGTGLVWLFAVVGVGLVVGSWVLAVLALRTPEDG